MPFCNKIFITRLGDVKLIKKDAELRKKTDETQKHAREFFCALKARFVKQFLFGFNFII